MSLSPQENAAVGGLHPPGSGGDLAGRLHLVQDEVATMESALGTGNMATGLASANGLVTVTTEMLKHLDGTWGLGPETDGELLATFARLPKRGVRLPKAGGRERRARPGNGNSMCGHARTGPRSPTRTHEPSP